MRYKVWDTAKSERGVGVGETLEAESAHEALKAWGKRAGCVVEFWTKHDPETGGVRFACATMRDRCGRRVRMGARMTMFG